MKRHASPTARLLSGAVALITAGTVFMLPAMAGTDTDNLTVSATIAASCTISTAAVAFGAYDPIVTHKAANLDGTGTVTVTCTDGSATTVTLGQGANADAGSTDTVPVRRMLAGGNYLSYFLYSEGTRTTVWGNDAASDVDHTGDGTATALTVYGRVTMDQNVPAGAYSDTVVATVTF
jgi:spore coat protein U-like protein